jgi:hypothetical protein
LIRQRGTAVRDDGNDTEVPSAAAVLCGACEMLGAAMFAATPPPLLENWALPQPERSPVPASAKRTGIHRFTANMAS